MKVLEKLKDKFFFKRENYIEIKKESERNILLSLRDGEKSLSDLIDLVPNIKSKEWMCKKLDDLNHRGLIEEKERGQYNIRYVKLNKKNVKFKTSLEEIIKPMVMPVIVILFCFFGFIIRTDLFLLFIGSILGFFPSLLWLVYQFLTKPEYIRIYELKKIPENSFEYPSKLP